MSVSRYIRFFHYLHPNCFYYLNDVSTSFLDLLDCYDDIFRIDFSDYDVDDYCQNDEIRFYTKSKGE